MRALISELGRDPLAGGLVPALARHVAKVAEQDGVDVRLEAPDDRLALPPRTEAHLFGIGREALANSVKHSGARHGVGARPGACRRACCSRSATTAAASTRRRSHPGHFGLESMRSRAAEIGGRLTISSAAGDGHRRPRGDGGRS